MKPSAKSDRETGCYGILANFQFYVEQHHKEICEGITLNISDSGFSFLTATEIRQGQTMTITKHSLPGFFCPKATVTWVKKGPRCIEAGADFYPDN